MATKKSAEDYRTGVRRLHRLGWIPVRIWLPKDVAEPILRRYDTQYKEREMEIRKDG